MVSQKYKTTGSISLFDEQETYQKLSAIGNPLEKICKVLDFEMFRETLDAVLLNKNKKNTTGSKPYDVVMIFKIIILQRFYGLGDKQVECQILDRLSFKRFLGLEAGTKCLMRKRFGSFRKVLPTTD